MDTLRRCSSYGHLRIRSSAYSKTVFKNIWLRAILTIKCFSTALWCDDSVPFRQNGDLRRSVHLHLVSAGNPSASNGASSLLSTFLPSFRRSESFIKIKKNFCHPTSTCTSSSSIPLHYILHSNTVHHLRSKILAQ